VDNIYEDRFPLQEILSTTMKVEFTEVEEFHNRPINRDF
jgi:hypothetical protein